MIAAKKLTRAQVFNFDESGLYIKQILNYTMVTRDENHASGTKKQLERITFAPCFNADGSLKLRLVFIGKSKNPRCLDKDKSNLPVIYMSQSNAWIDKYLFSLWFNDYFVPEVEHFLKENKLPLIAVLLVDNCRSHTSIKVRDIEVKFFPSNVTSLIQPADQGVIQAIKMKYQYLLVNSILRAQDKNVKLVDHLKTIKLDQAIFWISQAWDQVEKSTIYKCWKNLWPIETKDAFTQTDNEVSSASSLESSVVAMNDCLFRQSRVETEVYDDSFQDKNYSTEGLIKLIQQVYGFENIQNIDVKNWLEDEFTGNSYVSFYN